MPPFDLKKIEDIIRDVTADKILPRFKKLEEGHVRSKSNPNDLATIADDEAEEELTRILKDLLPGSQVLGEEAAAHGHTSREILKGDDPVWIVDPLDGTGNFARGETVFGTIISFVHRGENIAGWIYRAMEDRMFRVERGAGILVNEKPFQIRPCLAQDKLIYGLDLVGKGEPGASVIEKIRSLKKWTFAKTYRCCAYEYTDLLEGQVEFSIYDKIEPWDHMAGALMLEEAGFHIRKWDGTPYAAGDLAGGLINAPSEELWNRVWKAFLED